MAEEEEEVLHDDVNVNEFHRQNDSRPCRRYPVRQRVFREEPDYWFYLYTVII